ncbi:MAG: FAD-dependent oxidoreductase [Candidatus Eisenbacteria sp.]|nr:FAD-dependent oxidoreductase [Candidatus Eisenbacteria bacterium]
MKKPKFISEFADIPTPRTKMEELPVGEREGSFVEVEKGFTEEEALAEARRCLSCRSCIGCGLCLAECDRKAIVYDDQPRTFDFEVGAVILAPGFETFDARRKPEFGYEDSPNVITSVEMERILSPTGPFEGRLLRPLDAEIPKRIAFIQCVGCREESTGANYCATVCCMNAIKQARSTRDRIPDSEVAVFHRAIRPWGAGSEKYYLDAEEDSLIRFVEAEVSEVRPADESGHLSLTYTSGGEEKTEEFDLVILSVALAASRSARTLARKVQAKTNKYGFCMTGSFTPLETTAEGIFVAGAFSGPKDIGASVCQATGAAAAVLASLGAGESSTPETAPAGPRTGSKTAVLLCRYGLKTIGLEDLGGLKENLSENERVDWVTDDPFVCRALRKTQFKEELRKRDIGTIIATCCGETHQDLFDHAFAKDEDLRPLVRLIDVHSSAAVTAGSVLDRVDEILEEAGRKGDSAPARTEIIERVAVVGGGPAGLSAALNLARQDIDVDLIAVASAVGGRLARLQPPADVTEAPEEIARSYIENIEASDRIQVHLDTRVTGISGQPGAYRILGSRDGSEVGFEAGAVILATGAADYEPTEYPGDGRLLTQSELENQLGAGTADCARVAMIQCVGSRSREYPVCSQICCSQAIRNALKLKAIRPETEITVLHRGIRVFGFDEDLYTDAMEAGIAFLKIASPPAITPGDPVKVEFTGESGEQRSMEVDLVVLSTGLRPIEGGGGIAQTAGINLDEFGFFQPLERSLHPVESTREGIFICGLATGPKPLSVCIVEGLAAAGRAAAYLRQQATPAAARQ